MLVESRLDGGESCMWWVSCVSWLFNCAVTLTFSCKRINEKKF